MKLIPLFMGLSEALEDGVCAREEEIEDDEARTVLNDSEDENDLIPIDNDSDNSMYV